MSKLKVSVSKRLMALVSIVVIASVLLVLLYMITPKPITTLDYNGYTLTFRDDLRKAQTVIAYPGESEIYRDIMNPLVKNVTIAFKDAGEDQNKYYILEELEIVQKMDLAYSRMLSYYQGKTDEDIPQFNAMEVKEYSNLPGKIQNPIIALVHPKYANETAVRNDYHVTYISGKTPEEFDLATIKLLMIALNVNVSKIG